MKALLPLLVPLLVAAIVLAGCQVRLVEPPPEQQPPREAGFGRWAEFPVRYCIDYSRQGFVDMETFDRLVERAFREWRVEAVNQGPCDVPLAEGNNRNQLGWRGVEGLGGGEGGVYEAGVTRLRFVSPSGAVGRLPRLVEANIIIDPTPPPMFRSPDCLYTTVLHEVGHFLGLPHLEPPAIMAPVKTGCPQHLTDADRQALAELYANKRGR